MEVITWKVLLWRLSSRLYYFCHWTAFHWGTWSSHYPKAPSAHSPWLYPLTSCFRFCFCWVWTETTSFHWVKMLFFCPDHHHYLCTGPYFFFFCSFTSACVWTGGFRSPVWLKIGNSWVCFHLDQLGVTTPFPEGLSRGGKRPTHFLCWGHIELFCAVFVCFVPELFSENHLFTGLADSGLLQFYLCWNTLLAVNLPSPWVFSETP